jgi:tetratricopeptide (TPR) repeat protein
MERRVLKLLPQVVVILVLTLAFLPSCNVAPHVSVLRGNYAFGRGQYQTATVHYLTADVREEYKPWISYNLGNVYYALGEMEAASGEWEQALDDATAQIRFGVHFNRGVLSYELGRYETAYSEFRQALEIDGSSVDAKVNLELSLQKLEATRKLSPGRPSVTVSPDQEMGTQSGRILEYVRRKERQRWFADDRTQPDSAVNDW